MNTTKRRRDEESTGTAVSTTAQPSSFVKPASRMKTVARPEEPDGVEDVCYADVVTTVPTQLFKLDGLDQVLNMTTWEQSLSTGEKEYLLQFLPDVDRRLELLAMLLDGRTNFYFGNPMERIWQLMKQGGLGYALLLKCVCLGECHPRVAKYREGLRCLNHCQHFHNVRDYHNNMVVALRQMAQDDYRVPLDQRVEKWKAMTRNRSYHSSKLHVSRQINKK